MSAFLPLDQLLGAGLEEALERERGLPMSLAELFEAFWLWDQWGYPLPGQTGRLGALTRKWEALADAEKLALLAQIPVERRRKNIV